MGTPKEKVGGGIGGPQNRDQEDPGVRREMIHALDRLVRSLDREEADEVEELVEWCKSYVTGRHWRRHPPEDLEDVVQGALADTLNARRDHAEYGYDALARELIRALEKLRRAKNRERERLAGTGSIDEMKVEPTDLRSPEEIVGLAELLERVSLLLFEALESEIPRLSDTPHDIVSRDYGLEPVFPPRSPRVKPTSEGAWRTALCRAQEALRLRLTAYLEPMLSDSMPAGERLVVEVALRFVRDRKRMRELLHGVSGC